MSAIDRLKDKSGVISIDATGSAQKEKSIKPGETMEIDMVSGTEEKVSVEQTEMNLGNLRRHQVVLPKDSAPQPAPAPVARAAVEISAIGTPEPVDENIHESPQKDMLDLDNPDSMFSKYVQRKEDEAKEWIAEKQEEARVLAEEEALGETTEDTQIGVVPEETDSEEFFVPGEVVDTRMVGSYNMTVDEEDLSGLMEEEDNTSEEEISNDGEHAVVEEVPEPVSAAGELEVDVDVVMTDNMATEIVEEEEEAIEEDDTDILKHLQKLATERLKPVSKKLDISSFTVLKKPTTNVSNFFKETSARVSKWVLPSQESVILMKEFSGAELEKLREYSENSRSLDSLNRRFKMIYDHIMSPKPASFDTWLKTTPFEDVDSYFFAIYIASFKGANYIPTDCINTKCKETFITDNIDIMNMVEFEDDNAKKKFLSLYQSESTPAGKGVYCTEVVPLNDKIAVSFRQPSIYNIFEVAAIDDKTRAEYSSIIDYLPYIDTIYAIDMVNQELNPIGYKLFPDSSQRTIRSKIQKYHQILSTLNVDEFAVIKAYVKAIGDKTTGIYYIYPEIECPKCHAMTEKRRTSGEELVFIRYQLGTLVSTSLS